MKNSRGINSSIKVFSRKSLIFALTFACIAILSGCDKGGDDKDADLKVLYSALPAKITGFDPGNIGDYTTAVVAGQVFECLYQYHYLKRPYELIPLVAEDMPTVSEDGLTYTIKLKKGIYFTDDECFEGGKGRELVAQDFVYAWMRIADIKYRSKNWWIFDEKIVGLDEFREYTTSVKSRKDVDYTREVEGLSTPDSHTLVIKLKKPWPQIIYLLAHQPTSPVVKEAEDHYGKDIVSHPVGTGPFKLKKWHRGSYIEMERNAGYHPMYYPSEGEPSDAEKGFLDFAGERLPIVDKVVWTLIEEDQPRWLQFLRGKLDAAGIPKDNFGQAIEAGRELTQEMKDRDVHLEVFRDPSTFWTGFNMEDSVVGQNKALRLAISYAINRKEMIDLFSNGRGDVAYGFIPPIMKAYDPDVSKTGQFFDLEKAKVLVKEAEVFNDGKLPTLVYAMPGTDTLSRQTGQYYQRSLRQVGIKIEIEYMDWPTFLEKVKTKSVQIFSLGWIADIPDSENFLQLFYSPNASPGTNNFNYVSEEFDALYRKVAVMQPSEERTELYRKGERIVIEDCPAVFTTHRVAYVLHHDWVKNYKPHVFQYGLAKYRVVDIEQRKAYKDLLKKLKK